MMIILPLLSLHMLCSCHPQPEPQEKAVLSSSSRTLLDGKQLAAQYCTSCHLYPEPLLLNKATWQQYVLPRMGYFLGIYPHDSIREALIEKGEGGLKVEAAHIFPHKAQLEPVEWEAIQEFYSSKAPENLEKVPVRTVRKKLPHFKVRLSPYRLSPPSTTMIHITNNGFLLGDANTKRLYQFDANMRMIRAAHVREGAVSLTQLQDKMLITVMGSFSPTDHPSGFVMELPENPDQPSSIILNKLQRPVHASYADLDEDGLQDIITCEYGKWTGCLAWWKNQNNGQYKKQVLRNKPGAIKAYVQDFNQDGLPDVMALFGQGDEGIFIYYNQGEGKFKEETILHFPPSYGSSFFDLVDINEDGFVDIIYTAGDNADYPPVVKPYHGIRIFLNDQHNHFQEHFFYSLPGAYQAIPADFDQDGDIDIAAIAFFPDFQNAPEEGFIYLENLGNDHFQPYTFPEVNKGRWIVMDAGDFDQDGDQDILLGSLAFEVISKGVYLQQWIKEGIPFLVLENQVQ